MILVSNLSKAFGADPLFEGVTLELTGGRRYGLVGANGSGKSTFLKVLAGEEPPSDGTVTRAKNTRLGTLRQDRFLDDDEPIVEVAMQGDVEVYAALKELSRLDADAPDVATRASELDDFIRREDGYTLEARASEIVTGLGIPERALRSPLGTQSGGYKLRVLLAQVLVSRPDILLLDEPTNHLDILSIHWLEKFLAGFSGLSVIISHDQRFLNNVTTHTLDVDYESITAYNGNYDAFVVQKQAAFTQKQSEVERQERIIAEKQAFVDRFRAKATKARQAQSRLKQIEKISIERLPQSSRREPNFHFPQARPSGKDVLRAEDLQKAYGEKTVLSSVNLTVRRGERVAVIGANGLGKSTLLKVLLSRVDADRGSVEWGHEVQIGYFPQDHREALPNPKTTPLEHLWSVRPAESESTIRGQLGRALFSGDEVKKPIGALSGGESARLIFAELAVRQPNVLLLDEPTNHLDIEAIDGLVKALKSYPGTLLFVSHDRFFVGELADRILEIQESGIVDFPGTYSEYLARANDDHLDRQAVVERARAKSRVSGDAAPDATPRAPASADEAPVQAPTREPLSHEDRKRAANRKKTLPKLRDQVFSRIEALEAEKGEIDAQFCDPEFFGRASREEQSTLERRQAELAGEIESLLREWEGLEAELADLERASRL